MKALIVTSVASMVDQFLLPSIKILLGMNYEVCVACNFVKGSTCSDERIKQLRDKLEEWSVPCIQIDFARDVTNFSENVLAYKQIAKILGEDFYDIIHCHSPIGGLITRLAARKTRKKGTKVFYTAHGFHFFKGAPKKNWILYYPVEKICSYFTDVLITINREDYALAQKRMKAKKVEYIPGVGVDIARFKGCSITKEDKRKELGISNDTLVLLSVGELSSRKNHQAIIKALGKMNDNNILYLIAGIGEDYENYKALAKDLGIEKQVVLLGTRTDVDELCVAADVFVHPSVREVFCIDPLEGMAAGLPLISSHVNGIQDYTEDGVTGCCVENPLDIDLLVTAILKMKSDAEFRVNCGENNIKIVENFSLEASKACMKEICNTNPFGGGYYHLIRILKRIELGIKGHQYMLLSVGEINKNKNHQVIIDALKENGDKNCFYFIAGRGEERETLESLVDAHELFGNVKFLGYRTDIRELLFAADIYCFPSYREGLGLAAIEAMASGLPIVTSNIHGINDYSQDGVTGYKCAPNDIKGFATAINTLALDNQLREKMGQYNQKIAQRYDVHKIMVLMRQIYFEE